MFKNLQRDVLVLMASRGIRAFAFSYLGVVFAIYLSQLGYSTVTIGLVISTASASGAVLTALWGFLSDRFGRKKILMLAGGTDRGLESNLCVFQSSRFHSFGRDHRQRRSGRLRGRRTGRRTFQSC